MLIQKQELLPEVREHMRGGEGTVQLFQTPQDRLPRARACVPSLSCRPARPSVPTPTRRRPRCFTSSPGRVRWTTMAQREP